jgi:predicted ArsR family transcriptional regulator
MRREPRTVLKLDGVIHEKGRLAIMSLLAATAELSFTEMRATLDMTDGNLTAHIRTLQEAGYVSVTKSFHAGRPLTTYALRAAGKQAFATYIDLLEQIIQQTKPGP